VATWQADFHLRAIEQWPTDYRERLSRFLPRTKLWTSKVEVWGADDGDRIDVVLDEGGQPTEAFLRVDLRNWSDAFIISLLDFVRRSGLEIESELGSKIEPTRAAFALALRSSPAFRFVDDPRGFLDRLAPEDRDDS